MREEKPIASGGRIAVIGAGPAGCLAAAAILDLAILRGLDLSVSLYGSGGGSVPRADEPLLAEERCLNQLTAAGLPSSFLDANRLSKLELRVGGSSASFESGWYALPRGDLIAGLRACAAARGARLIGRRVEAVSRTVDGGWILRASGASERADRIVLACGVGAPMAAGIPAHQPPPLVRSCVATLDLDETLASALSGKLLRIAGRGEHPSLLLVSSGERAWVYPEGGCDPKELGLALLAASSSGALPGAFGLHGVQRTLLADGMASPGCPTVGAALGGSPSGAYLGSAATQAQQLAASILYPEPLEASLIEIDELGRGIRRKRKRRQALARFGGATLEEALRWSGPGSAPLREALASASSPAPIDDRGQSGSEGQRVSPGSWAAAWLTLLLIFFVAWIRRLFSRCRSQPAAQGPPAAASEARGGETPALPSRLVYLIEDDPDCAELLGAALRDRRIPYRIFQNGIEAAAMAAIDRPAAIVLDVVLPWIDGISLAGTLKAQSDAKILLTTSLPRWRVERLRPAGVDRLFTKPLDPELLAGRLARYLPAAPGDPVPRRHSG